MKLTLWKNENEKEKEPEEEENPKWMSSKMRLMQKMKNSVGSNRTRTSSSTVTNHIHDEDHHHHHKQQVQGSSSLIESDHFSSNTSSKYNGNPTVRVCADCNTTKTPLWRSGPKGPKVYIYIFIKFQKIPS